MSNDDTPQATPRFQALAAIAAHGKMTAGEIKAKTSLDDRQVGNALYAAKGADHVTRDAKGAWHLTKLGRAWLTGGAKFSPASKRTSPAEVKSSRRQPARKGRDLDAQEQQRAGVVKITARGAPVARTDLVTDAPAPPRTRFAIFNDGHFFITKNGVDIDLDPEEHKQLLHYLDRLAEPLARAA